VFSKAFTRMFVILDSSHVTGTTEFLTFDLFFLASFALNKYANRGDSKFYPCKEVKNSVLSVDSICEIDFKI
jgi:hypothetical protein